MKKYILLVPIVFSLLVLGGCFDDSPTQAKQINEISNNDVSKEIQKLDSVQLGKIVFENNCVVCHGQKGQGIVKDWRKQVDGKYPPPPLDGTAHTWHHSPALLLKIVNNGGTTFGGDMPPFKDKLNEGEKQAVLDYLYYIWPSKIKKSYDERFKK